MSVQPPYPPPKWAVRFLHWFCKEDIIEDLLGDLEEEHTLKAKTRSSKEANKWFVWQVLLLFKPRFIKPLWFKKNSTNSYSMFQNHLKIGFRSLKKNKISTLINTAGLSVGMACFILIALFVADELSYDRHFSNPDDIYRVTVKNYDQNGSVSRQWAFASAGHAERLKEDYASFEYATRFFPWAFPDIRRGDLFLPAEQVVFTDNDVFKVFDFQFIQGDPAEAFEDLYSIVLTASSATKIFGNEWSKSSLLGETIEISRDGLSGPFKVTGVIEDMPEQQHFHFEYLAPIRFIEQVFGEEAMANVGGNYNWLTYVKTTPNVDMESLETQVNDEFWDKYIGIFDNGMKAKNYYDFYFQPMLDIHLQSNLEGEIESNGSIRQVRIFSIIGLLLLVTAIVNYMNLSTAQYSKRMKEVGVRKAIGATKKLLVGQFLTESILITTISLPIALIIVQFTLPYLNDFVGKQLSLGLTSNYSYILSLLVLMMLVGFISGIYPSMLLSKVQAITALKGEQVMRGSGWGFRSILVTFQYAVVISLIFGLTVVKGQLSFIQKTNPGYNKEQLINLDLTRGLSNLDVFRQELLSHPSISAVTYSSRIPTGRLADSWGASFYQKDSLVQTSFRLPFITADHEFLNTFEIPLLAGEYFSPGYSVFEDSIGNFIINRSAAEALGYKDPKELIGESLAYGPFDGQSFDMGKVVGVMEDFHFESMHSQIVPMLIMKDDNRYREAVIKIGAGEIQSAIQHIEATFASLDPVGTANYRFMDELFAEQYVNEQRLGSMISVFTGIAIFIGCLGIIGLVSFIVETRTKEIGIRKVLGASAGTILLIIGKRFLILVGLAFLVIMPIAFYLLNGWLDNFVYRTEITVFMIMIPLLSAMLITLLTTSYQTLKAARINPVYCLKDE